MSLRDLKGLLLFVMAIGAAAYFGGGATFASFSAETSNAGSSVASGTLTMTDQVNGGTVCASAGGSAQNNVNPACAFVLQLTNVAPGVFGGVGQVTVQNTGSIDASKFYMWAPFVNATLSAGISGTVNSLPITALEGTVANGDSIVVSFGTHTQTFIANAAAVGGAASIGIGGAPTANFAYPIGTIVTDTSSNTSASNTDCWDKQTTGTGPPSGPTVGTNLNFNPTTGNPMCAALLIYVQETTGGKNYCWLGPGTGSASGMCTAPISVSLTTGLTNGVSVPSLAVAGGLNGNVKSGDAIVVTSGSSTQTFNATANAYFGATSITVTPVNANFSYPIGSTVIDSATLTTLSTDTTDTIKNFDTGHNALAGTIQLPPVASNGVITSASPVQLGHFSSGTYPDTRVFRVGVFLPGPSINQNFLQGLQSTFGITWHIDQ